MATTTPTTPSKPNLGNEIDAVIKKKYSFDLPFWAYALVAIVANLVGVFFHV